LRETPGRGDLGINEAWLALAGTLFGGAGFKIIESLLGRAGRKDNTATSLRTELRLEISTMRVEMDKLRKEADAHDAAVDQWRDKYYALLAAVAVNDTATLDQHTRRKRRG
jgi:hypothetical protein